MQCPDLRHFFDMITTIIGVIFAFIAVGLLGVIALFFACDKAALHEESKRAKMESNRQDIQRLV